MILSFQVQITERNDGSGESSGVVEEEVARRGRALAVHARPVYGEGDAPHEQGLPQGLFQNEPLRL